MADAPPISILSARCLNHSQAYGRSHLGSISFPWGENRE